VGKTTIQALSEKEGAKRYYMTAEDRTGLAEVAHGTAITTGEWTELVGSEMQIAPAAGHTVVRVVEVDDENKPIASGDAVLNIG